MDSLNFPVSMNTLKNKKKEIVGHKLIKTKPRINVLRQEGMEILLSEKPHAIWEATLGFFYK